MTSGDGNLILAGVEKIADLVGDAELERMRQMLIACGVCPHCGCSESFAASEPCFCTDDQCGCLRFWTEAGGPCLACRGEGCTGCQNTGRSEVSA